MLLYAKPYIEDKIKELKNRVDKLEYTPKLVILRVDGDKASEKYVNNKVKRCEEVGIESEVILFDNDVAQEVVARKIVELNNSIDVTAILLQLPIPKHLNEGYLTNLIDPLKDVDGFTIENTGKLSLGLDCNTACTPRGIIDLLKFYDIEIEGSDVLIINRSNIIGKPLAQLFLKENATVTIVHSKTKNLEDKIKCADIVVTAVGKANFLQASSFSDNTTIIDVSINFNEDGRICGDVTKSDYDALINKNCNITPVPGGIGQTTVISLIEQTIEIAERLEGK